MIALNKIKVKDTLGNVDSGIILNTATANRPVQYVLIITLSSSKNPKENRFTT